MESIVYFICGVCLLNSEFFSFSVGPIFLDLFRVGLILLVILYLTCSNYKVYLYKFKSIKKHVRLPLVFLAISIVQLLWVKDIIAWLKVVFTLFVATMLFIFIPLVIDNNRKVLNCIKSFHFGVLIQLVLGYYEMFTGNYLFVGNIDYVLDYQRYINLFGIHSPVAMNLNTNNFATTILIGCCFGIVLYLNSDQIYKKIFYFLTILLSGFAIYCTDSRANMISFLLMVGLYTFFFIKSKAVKICILFMLIVSVCIAIPYFNGYFTAAGSDQTRMALYKDGMLFLFDTYLLGIGPGQEEWWLLNRNVFTWRSIRALHNYFLEILVSFGVSGLVCFISMYIKSIKIAFTAFFHRDGLSAKIGCGVVLLMIVFVISSLSASSLIRSEYIWLVYAIILAYMNNVASEDKIMKA